MISDIKVNYAIIGELRDKIATYKSAIETMEESLNNINSRLESENSGEAVAALISKHEDLKGDISACKGELEDLYKLFSGFHDEMTEIIHPMSYGALMRVDRDDIWWNMQSIIGACTAIGIMRYNVSTYRSFPSFSDSKEEKENQERNYRKIEEIWDIINSYKSGFDSEIDYMNNLFNSKVVPYEEMDNNYASMAHETYTRYVTTWERIVDGIIDFSQMVGNFVDGVIKSVEDLIKGLVGLVKGVSVYAVGAVAVAITKVTGDTPDWLKGAEEDFYKDNEMIKAVLDDPSIIVEGIAQQVSDAKDEKGLVYCTGYTAGLIAQMVLLKKVKGGSGAEEVKDFYRKNPADPIRDVLGSGLKSNPAEWNKLINAMKDNGVEIVYRDGTMAYSPGLVPGAPGQLIIDKNASMSALIHEYQHYLDDLASGLPGMRQLYEQNPRVIKELRAYMKEIKIADELGLKDVSSQLWENYRQERESILNLFKE